MAGGGVTFLPVTVMSIRLIDGVEDVEDEEGAEVCVGVEGAEVCVGVEGETDGSVDETVPVREQDATTSAALRPRAAIMHRCRCVVSVTVGSLGRFV